MPTYQYACTNPDCGERFERVQAFTDPAVTECPVCGQGVRKVFSAVGVVFKGSGFYRTDSRSGSSSGGGKSSENSSSSSTAKSDSGSSSGSSSSGSSANGSSSSTGTSGSSGSSGSSSGSTSKAAASA